jgi:hypothetical protein
VSLSREWTEWHLTPRGWERGTEKTDFAQTTVNREPPADRVLTFSYEESVSGMYSKCEKSLTEEWRHEDAAEVDKLLARWGPCPERL